MMCGFIRLYGIFYVLRLNKLFTQPVGMAISEVASLSRF